MSIAATDKKNNKTKKVEWDHMNLNASHIGFMIMNAFV